MRLATAACRRSAKQHAPAAPRVRDDQHESPADKLKDRTRATIVAVVFGLMSMVQGTPALAVDPGPVHQCGSFVSYRPPNSARSGELIIGETTYAAAWMGSTGPAGSTPHAFNQVVAPGVTRGSQACLDGTVVLSQTEGALLTDFTVSLAATASPAATTSPLGSVVASTSPLGSAVAAASPSQLSSASTDAPWIVALLAAALIVGLITFALRRRSASAT